MKHELNKTKAPIKLWDTPIRVWHFAIIILLIGLWGSAKFNAFSIHRALGILMMSALCFRLYWGIVGGSSSRFSHFIKGPKTIFSYVKSSRLKEKSNAMQAGHNPIGGWSVLAMLTALILQSISGLFSVDIDGLNSGPMARLVSFDVGRVIAKIHAISFHFVIGFIILHIAAIGFYLIVKKTNLITAMITGKTNRHVIPLVKAPLYTLLMGLAGTGILAWYLWKG